MNMNDPEITIATLEGLLVLKEEELAEQKESLDYFARSQDYWRSKYIQQHPEMDTWLEVERMEENL